MKEVIEDDSPLVARAGGLTGAFVNMTEREAAVILARVYGYDGVPSRVATEKDDTFLVCREGRLHAVLKVSNPAEDEGEIDFQTKLMQHVAKRDPTIPIPTVLCDRQGQLISRIVDAAGQTRFVRMMTAVPGTPLDRTDSRSGQREKIGILLARLRLATEDFQHPSDSRLLAWDVRHASELSGLVQYVRDDYQRELLSAGLQRIYELKPQVDALRTQVLHNDFSKSNIIVDHGSTEFIKGIIDFGDSVRTAIAIDVSTALANQLPTDPIHHPDGDLFACGRDVLRGYLRTADLSSDERALLPHLVMVRVVVRALITQWRAQLFPDNAAYILRNTEPGWAQLEWLLCHSADELSNTLINVAPNQLTLIPRRSQLMSTKPRGKMNNAFDPSRVSHLTKDAQLAVKAPIGASRSRVSPVL